MQEKYPINLEDLAEACKAPAKRKRMKQWKAKRTRKPAWIKNEDRCFWSVRTKRESRFICGSPQRFNVICTGFNGCPAFIRGALKCKART